MSQRLLIKGGRVVTSSDTYTADVLCVGGAIAAIGTDLPETQGTRIIDARGRLLMPGFIDPHVHVHLPFMGTFAKDTWESASKAALLGGTTTLIEMICPGKADRPLEAFETWLSKAQQHASCDYSFHMGVTRFDDEAESDFRAIVGRGIRSFKVFLAYKGALGVDDRELYQAMSLARELGVVMTAHCENETVIAHRQQALLAAGHTAPYHHEASRPTSVEAMGVRHACDFAHEAGATLYIVHTSCDDAVREALAARSRGLNVQIEVVIPHLILNKSAAERTGDDGFEGAKFVMSPPLRDESQRLALWQHIETGVIDTVATDHAPFDFRGQKELGRGDFTKIPNGIPSVQHRAELLFTHGVAANRITPHRFVDLVSTKAARTFGLKSKGSIHVGADADLVVWDPHHRSTISARTHAMATDYSAFEGMEVTGRAETVTLRGHVMVDQGRFVGPPCVGMLVERS